MFAALNAKTSEVITQFHQRHRSAQFREFLKLIDTRMPHRLDVHIIMDNYGTHETPLIRNWFARHPRFHVHFTPTYGSWLSLVERWFAELTMKQIRRGTFRSVPQLKAAIQDFIDAHQADPMRFGRLTCWLRDGDVAAAVVSYSLVLMPNRVGETGRVRRFHAVDTADYRKNDSVERHRRCPGTGSGLCENRQRVMPA